MGRALVARGLYPTVLGVALIASWWLYQRGFGPVWSTGPVVVAAALCIAGLERLFPHTPKWTMTRRAFWVDLAHSLVSANLVAPLVRGSVLAGSAWLATWASAAWGAEVWPSAWPLPFQVALAIVVGDLGAYLGHRFMHRTEIGWRIHAVHHSAERLYWLASGRSHPFNAVLTLGLETGFVVLLGITPEALVLMTVFKGTNGLLQHSNVRLRPGWLSYVVATSDVHRWHHSRDFEESNTNFGNSTMVWDHVFGTFFLPRDRSPRLEVGIAGAQIPERYLAHLAAPFVLPRYEDPPAGD